MVSHLSSSQQIRAVFHANRKCLQGVLHLGRFELLQQGGGNQTGIQAPYEQESVSELVMRLA